MKKHGPRVNAKGEIVHGFNFAKVMGKRKRKNKVAKQARKVNRQH